MGFIFINGLFYLQYLVLYGEQRKLYGVDGIWKQWVNAEIIQQIDAVYIFIENVNCFQWFSDFWFIQMLRCANKNTPWWYFSLLSFYYFNT